MLNVLLHESRPLPVWLIFDVRQRMKRRFRYLGVWLVGIYLLLALTAFLLPQEKLGMPAVIFSLVVAELAWPWTIVYRKIGIVNPTTMFVLWFIVAPLWFWIIGTLVSLVASRLFPPREKA